MYSCTEQAEEAREGSRGEEDSSCLEVRRGQITFCQGGELSLLYTVEYNLPVTCPVEAGKLTVPCAAQSYDVAEFQALTEKYDKLNWRILSKPGGATMKPDEYYTLYG